MKCPLLKITKTEEVFTSEFGKTMEVATEEFGECVEDCAWYSNSECAVYAAVETKA